VGCGLVCVEDAQAQQIEARAPVHLAFEQLKPMDVAFDGAVVPGEAKRGQHGSLVAPEIIGEAGQCGVPRLFQPTGPGRDVSSPHDAEELGAAWALAASSGTWW